MAANLIEFAQELKRQVAIEQLIGDHVPSLRRAGKSYKGLCPFHEEKTPSFHVHPEFGFYHCFGCHARGDAIKFVQEFEKIDFRLAVETIAKRFGVPLPEFGLQRSQEERDEATKRRETLLAICHLAEEFFVEQLVSHPKAAAAKEYLHGRGLTDDQIKLYRLGYAPPGYETFLKKADQRGYKAESVAEAGLASQGERGFIDRFRDRITFPIADQRGDVIAFGGRLMEGDGPKYLNSADTPLFHKGKLLYGLVHAREAIREQERAILLEGYMDWIALHSHGTHNVVAGLGTALTEDQARLLSRMTREVVLHYDGDEAGRKAMFRATEVLLSQGLNVRVAMLPEGHDPDSFIRAEGKAASRTLLENAAPALDTFLDQASDAHPNAAPEAKVQIFESLSPLIVAIRDPILQEGYINRLADRLGIQARTLAASLKKKNRSRTLDSGGNSEAITLEASEQPLNLDKMECYLLNFIIANIERWDLFDALEPELFQNKELQSVFSSVHKIARDVWDGAAPPSDWFQICDSERERSALVTILSLGGVLVSGELRQGFEDFPNSRLTEEFQSTVARLRRRRMKRDRLENSQKLKRNPGSVEDSAEWLHLIHSDSERIDQETRRIVQNP